LTSAAGSSLPQIRNKKVISEHLRIMMDTLTTHPSTAAEARAFTAPHSLSFPGGAGHITPPSEKESQSQSQTNGQVNGHQPAVNGAANGTGPASAAAPATPAATPAELGRNRQPRLQGE